MPQNLQQLPRIKDSVSFLYVEHCRIEQDAMSIAKFDREGGKTPIPVANLTCLLVGPGTNITSAAVKAITDCGCSVVWCGENGMRFYAYGRGETRSSKNLLIQAKLCMNDETHMKVVEKMYRMRFGNIPTVGKMTLNQLRGIEGVRMKQVYIQASKRTGIPWKSRDLGRGKEWNELEPMDKALIYSSKILYAVCSSVIVSMGLSTGLGFIHTGRQESFSYDIADLYKADTTIPASFDAVKEFTKSNENLENLVRKYCRQYFNQIKLMKKISQNISDLLDFSEEENDDPDSLLWNNDGTDYYSGSWNLAKLLSGGENGCNNNE